MFGNLVGGTVAGFFTFDIPGGATRDFRGKWEIKEDISLLNVWPHMHYLGKEWEIVLHRPDGSSENLIRINDWNFNWQGSYTFKKYIKAPAGSRVLARALFDNTSENDMNPSSPPKSVDWGEKTTDEMYFLPFSYVPYVEGDEHLSLESFSPGDLPVFRLAGLTDEIIEFRLQVQDRAFVLQHSSDMRAWSEIGIAEDEPIDANWRALTIPRTDASAGFYRAVITP